MYEKVIFLTRKMINSSYSNAEFDKKMLLELKAHVDSLIWSKKEQEKKNALAIYKFFLKLEQTTEYIKKVEILTTEPNLDVLKLLVSTYYKTICSFGELITWTVNNPYAILPKTLGDFICDVYHFTLKYDNLNLHNILAAEVQHVREINLINTFDEVLQNNATNILGHLLDRISAKDVCVLLDTGRFNTIQKTTNANRKNILSTLLTRNNNMQIKERLFFAIQDVLATEDVIELMQLCLDHKVNINAVDKDRMSILQRTKELNADKVVPFLIANGAKIDYEEVKTRYTALHYATLHNQPVKVQSLIKAKANLEIVDANGDTSLLLGIRKTNFEVVKILVENGANLLKTDKNGYTPLQLAAQLPKSKIVKTILKKAGNQTAIHASGYMAVHFAAAKGTVNTIKHLIKGNINVLTNNGYTPLHLAIINNNLNVISYLVTLGADYELMDAQGFNALQLVILHSSSDILTAILAANETNVKFKDKQGNNLLHFAVMNKKEKLIQSLITAGVDAQAVNAEGFAPLHLAIKNCELATVKNLILANLNRNAIVNDGLTLLHLAIEYNRRDLLELLVASGVPVDTPAENSLITPLDLAIKCENKAIFLDLIRLGAQLDPKNSITEVCIKSAGPEMSKFLEDYWQKLKSQTNEPSTENKRNDDSTYYSFNLVQQPVNTTKMRLKKSKPPKTKQTTKFSTVVKTDKIPKQHNVTHSVSFKSKQHANTIDKHPLRQDNVAKTDEFNKQMEKVQEKYKEKAAERKKDKQQLLMAQELQASVLFDTDNQLPNSLDTSEILRLKVIEIANLKIYIKENLKSRSIYTIFSSEVLDHEKGRPGFIINIYGDKCNLVVGSSTAPKAYNGQKFVAIKLSKQESTITHFAKIRYGVDISCVSHKWITDQYLTDEAIECMLDLIHTPQLYKIAEQIRISNLESTNKEVWSNYKFNKIEEAIHETLTEPSAIKTSTQTYPLVNELKLNDELVDANTW